MSVRYTPFLDKLGIKLKDTVPDNAANIIDSALHAVSDLIDWGEYEGRKRKPCSEQPLLLTGLPLGQYHCPGCDMMILAGAPHIAPGATAEQKAHPEHPLADYEDEYGKPWPPGYEDVRPAP